MLRATCSSLFIASHEDDVGICILKYSHFFVDTRPFGRNMYMYKHGLNITWFCGYTGIQTQHVQAWCEYYLVLYTGIRTQHVHAWSEYYLVLYTGIRTQHVHAWSEYYLVCTRAFGRNMYMHGLNSIWFHSTPAHCNSLKLAAARQAG